jgi:predicted transport protein
MALYKNSAGKLSEVNEQKIKLERDIQTLTEKNLQTIFSLDFVATEFEHNGLRLDSVAFDHTTNAFVIIEYKRDRSFSVVDQGYAYLALLLNNKAEFILLYNENTGKQLSKSTVDWTQSRVIFVAQNFTIHQQQAINFKDMPIELWQVRMYDNDTVLYSQLKASDKTESIKTVTRDSTVQSVSSEVKVYNISDHFTGARSVTFDLYEQLRDRLTTLAPNVYENPRGNYIGFSLKENGTDTFVYINIQVGAIKLHIPRIRPEDVNDPLSSLEYKKNSFETKHTPESVMFVRNEEDVDYAVSILRQVIKLKFS